MGITLASSSMSEWPGTLVRCRLLHSTVQLETSPFTERYLLHVPRHSTQHVRPLPRFCSCWSVRLEQSSGPCLPPERHRSCFQAPVKDISVCTVLARLWMDVGINDLLGSGADSLTILFSSSVGVGMTWKSYSSSHLFAPYILQWKYVGRFLQAAWGVSVFRPLRQRCWCFWRVCRLAATSTLSALAPLLRWCLPSKNFFALYFSPQYVLIDGGVFFCIWRPREFGNCRISPTFDCWNCVIMANKTG